MLFVDMTPLLEKSLSRACVGDFLPARGGGQISPGQ